MKFILFCEGLTEKRALPDFLKRWLDPQLSQPVGISPVRFNGWPELLKDAPKKARLHLDGPDADDIVGVIALLDLYGPTYPSDKTTIAERAEWIKAEIEKRVGQRKFRLFTAVHETEAWLLSQPGNLPGDVARALPGKVQTPETVNFDQPPSKLLNQLYLDKTGRGYKKVAYGADLFGKLDPAAAYNKCPYLKQLLDELLKMARAAGL